MNRYVCAVSSIYPIELASIIMNCAYHLFTEEDYIQILVNEDAEVPKENKRRIQVARLGIPTPLLLLDEKGVYKQVFLPLIKNDPQANLNSLSLSIELLDKVISSQGTDEIIKGLRVRGKFLIDSLAQSPHLADPANLLAEIIGIIYGDILKKNVSVGLYATNISNQLGQYNTIQALLKIGREIYNASGECKFVFSKGGYVQLSLQNGEQLQVDQGIVTRDELVLTTRATSSVIVKLLLDGSVDHPLSIYLKNYKIESKFCLVRLRGPLELAYLTQIGTVLDVPWYCENVSVNIPSYAAYIGIESISPISVADSIRSSSYIGGGGKRLNPSGYSLVDYHHPASIAFASSIAGIRSLDFDSFSDWRRILDNHPVIKQKAAKYQGGVPAYCKARLLDIRKMLLLGLHKPIGDITEPLFLIPSFLGERLLNLVAILRYMWDCTVDSTKFNLTDSQSQAIEKIELTKQGVPLMDSVSDLSLKLLNESIQWRHRVSQSIAILDEYEDRSPLELVRILSEQKGRDVNLLYVGEPDRQGLKKYARMLEDEAILYYKCVLAICASVLKANLWTAWLLMGNSEYIRACEDIILRRGQNPLHLTSQLWELDK